jgi:DNA primase
MIDANAVKDRIKIEEIVGEDEPLRPARGGRRFEGRNHHSLTVYPEDGYYVWFSQGERGDVFDWLRHHRGMDFTEALHLLARRANMDLEWSPEQRQQYERARQTADAFTAAARHWARLLRASEPARAYCQDRGWEEGTIQRAGLGFYDGDQQALKGALQSAGVDLNSTAAQAVLRCPAGMLVYPHVERGRVVYWSARSIEGKQHYNPPRDLVGERRPFYNQSFAADVNQVVIVEGQADAVSLDQWHIAAVALAGCSMSLELGETLLKHNDLVVGLDDDEEGQRGAVEIADALGPLVRVVRWPAKDVNDWLKTGATAEQANVRLRAAPAWIEVVAAGAASADDRDEALRHMVELASRLTEFQLSTRREELAKSAGIGLRQFDKLLKAVESEQEQAEQSVAAEREERFVPGGVIETDAGPMVFEMIITGGNNGDRHSVFAVRRPDGRIETVRSIESGPLLYLPYEPTMPLIEKGVVLLPSAVGEYESTQALVQEIRGFIHAFLDISPLYERIAVYYVLLSWLYDCFTVLPYLRALGDYGTGKSRFLETIGSVCYRPIKTSGASTFSPVFRIIEMFHGTLILDEMDMTMSDTEADFIKLLNSGIARGTPLLRTEKANDKWVVEAYDTFCPKVVATRKRFQDRALESRMLTYEMTGNCRLGIPLVLPSVFYEAAQDLRNKLLAYRLRNWRRMEVDYSLADRTVEPRLAQVTLALKTIVDDPTLQEEIDAFIREYHRQTVVERGMTLAALILEVIIEQHEKPTAIRLDGQHDYDLSLKTIAEITNKRMDEENYGEDEQAGRNRPRLTPRKVGEEVRKLGLGTERRRDKSRNYDVIWDEERVQSLKVRYGLE